MPLLERPDRFSSEVFSYVVCRECGLIYLNPRPGEEDILSHYPCSYEAYQPLDTLGVIPHWRRRHALSILRRFVSLFGQPGRLLDVGCATGEFLGEMQAHGWAVKGVEINPQVGAIAQENYGLDVFVGPLRSIDSMDGAFDIVTLWDVLEHLPSPLDHLRRIHCLLNTGGRVIFSIPNLCSFDAQVFGHWWIGWDAPRHLYLFPMSALKRLLAHTGFRVEEQCCLLGGPGAFRLSLQFWLDQRARSSMTKGRAVQTLVSLLPHLLWPYKELSYVLGRGPVLTVVARKLG